VRDICFKRFLDFCST